MNCIKINSMPEFRFAHEHYADSYRCRFVPLDDKIEISYVVEGGLKIERDGEIYTASPGDVECFLYDRASTIYTKKFHRHRTVCAQISWSIALGADDGLYIPRFISHSDNTSKIIAAIDELVCNSYKYSSCSTRFAAAFLNILCAIDDIARKKPEFSLSETSLWAQKAKRYINQNIHLPLTQAEIAAHLGISPGYLCSVFKKSEHMTVMKYINTVKLKNIRALVEGKKLRLCEACAMFGYNDANYVSALYKKLFGYNITDVSNLSDELKG